MNDHQRRRYERAARVRDFAETYKSALPVGGKGVQSAELIKGLIDRLDVLDASRSTNTRGAREGTSGKTEALESLRALLSQISRTARAVSLDDPAFRERFRLPRNKLNAQALVSTARSFLAEATPLKPQFVEYGMGEDFLETLTAKIDAYENHDTHQHTQTSARVANAAAIDAALDELDDEVKRFDIIARNRFADDAAALAALRSARRIEQAPRVRQGRETPPDNPPPDNPPA